MTDEALAPLVTIALLILLAAWVPLLEAIASAWRNYRNDPLSHSQNLEAPTARTATCSGVSRRNPPQPSASFTRSAGDSTRTTKENDMSLNRNVSALTHPVAGRNWAHPTASTRPTTWLALLFTAAFLSISHSAHAQNCSAGSLRGSFGYTVTGTVTTSFGPLVAGLSLLSAKSTSMAWGM